MEWMNHDYINRLLEQGKNPKSSEIEDILMKAYNRVQLSHLEMAMLINADESYLPRIFEIAGNIKDEIYGKRVVTFAPLYVSNKCVNNCLYCGYRRDNKFARKKLDIEVVKREALSLEKMGHKRIAFEMGEDPVDLPIDYVVDCLKAIYESSDIRRINVNIAATDVESFTKLREVGIGTYILFQETYHKDTFEKMHPKSLKGNYDYHLTAFDRAQQAKVDDCGAGVLFGLYDYKFELLGLMLHNEHLESEYGVGLHTISVPRLKKAEGMELSEFEYIISDAEFKRIVATIRLMVPFVGIILSTRETKEIREELITHGVSQISAGSNTDVGGYSEDDNEAPQFELSDERSVLEVMKSLVDDGLIPSFCTACYRSGRTGDRFMRLAKSGKIGDVCEPNALMTLMEYLMDYADEDFRIKGKAFILNAAEDLKNPKVKDLLLDNIKKIEAGKRDLFL